MDLIQVKHRGKTYDVSLCDILQCSRMFLIQYSNPEFKKEKEIIINDDFSTESVKILVNYFKTRTLPLKFTEQIADELLVCADYLRIDYLIKCLDWKDRKAKIFYLEDYGLSDKEGEDVFKEGFNNINLPYFEFYAKKFDIETKEGDIICERKEYMIFISCINYKNQLVANEDFWIAGEFSYIVGREYPFDYWLDNNQQSRSIVSFNVKPFYAEMKKNLKKLNDKVYRTTFQIFHRVFKLYLLPMGDDTNEMIRIDDEFGNIRIQIGDLINDIRFFIDEEVADVMFEDGYKVGIDLVCLGYIFPN